MEGKIYKICSENGDKIYIGSTTKSLSRRMWGHKAHYKMWKTGNSYRTMSCVLFDEYGVDKCNIVLLEEFSCETKQQLHEREAYYIKTMSCVNRCVPLRTQKEWYQENQEQIKEYRQDNKEQIAIQKKNYYQANKEKIKEHHNEWYQANKEKRKEYLQANKEKLKEQQKAYYQARKAKVSSQPV